MPKKPLPGSVDGLKLKRKCAKPDGWKPKKPFLKGNKMAAKENAPNNTGRPKGSKNFATQYMEDAVKDMFDGVINATYLSALKGNPASQRLILERTLAPLSQRKGVPLKISLGDINTPDEIVKTIDKVFKHIEEGQISPEEANMINSVLETKLKAIEIYHQGDEIKELKAAMGIKDKVENK